jgi:hypothetical protein
MAKKHKNLDNLPIQWNGDLSKPSDGSAQSSPDNIDLGTWGDNPYTWDDVSFVIELADGIGTGNRRAREARLNQLDKDKKNRLIRLICRVKGELVYDEEKEVGDVHIKLEDADLVIKEVLGKMRVENTNVL